MLPLLLTVLAAAQARVELLSEGDAPRQELRLAWADGVQDYTEVTRNHVAVQLGGLLVDPAPHDTRQQVRWIARSSGNTLSVEVADASFTTTGSEPPPDLSRLVGLTGTLVVDDQGRLLDHDVDPPPGPLTAEDLRRVEAMGRRVQQVTLPMPAEPVGVGARWRIIDRMDAGPMTVDLVTTATLLARQGDRVTLRLSTRVAPTEKGVTQVDLDGFSGKVQELEVSGTQDVELRLDRPVALTRSGRIHTHVVVKGWKGPFPVTVTMDVSQRITATANDR